MTKAAATQKRPKAKRTDSTDGRICAAHAAHRAGRTPPAAPAHDDGKAADVEVGGGGGGHVAVRVWVRYERTYTFS